MNEQLKILEMIEKGQISAAEGMELLEALKQAAEQPEGGTQAPRSPIEKRKYKFLKIRVTSENKSVNVNVNIPIRLLTVLGGMAGKVTAYIPEDARAQMEAKGVDVSGIDFSKIIEDCWTAPWRTPISSMWRPGTRSIRRRSRSGFTPNDARRAHGISDLEER
jgi:hypothetical protein